MTTRHQARAAVQEWFDANPDLALERVGDDGWFTTLAGERKRVIPLFLQLGDQTLTVESHFMRAPDENEAALYELLLRRNARTYVLRFAVLEGGDIALVAALPLAAVTAAEIDRVAGTLLSVADETYNAALRLGFEGYIEREQAWRERVGLGRNPIT